MNLNCIPTALHVSVFRQVVEVCWVSYGPLVNVHLNQ